MFTCKSPGEQPFKDITCYNTRVGVKPGESPNLSICLEAGIHKILIDGGRVISIILNTVPIPR